MDLPLPSHKNEGDWWRLSVSATSKSSPANSGLGNDRFSPRACKRGTVVKKYIVVASVLLLLVSMKVSAQWQPNPYTSGDIFFNGNVGIGATPVSVVRLRLNNPPVATETPGSGAQLGLGTTDALWWLFRLDSAFNLYLDRNNNGWKSSMTFTNSGRVGIGTSTPAEMLDVSGNILSKGLKVVFNGNAFIQTNGTYAGFLAESGDGTSSTRFSFTDYTTRETAPLTWRVGMNGARSFSIYNMTTGVGLVILTEAGDFTVNGNILGAGNITANGNIAAKYQDVAEWVPAATEMAAGTVVVLDPERPNEVMPSSQAYDTTVAGVVSAQPGLILGEAGEAKAKIAATGRVKVKVDATQAPVKIGDLLVTSERPGYAMKSQPLNINGRNFHQPGTVVGKALEPLDKGTGEILVLLSLQ
jgi:hypothetical protein